MTPLLKRKCLIGYAAESTFGTSAIASVTTSAGLLAYDAQLVPVDITSDGEREPDGHYLGQIVAVPGKRMGRLTFRHEVRHGDGYLTLLTFCGYANATGYKPSSTFSNHKTASFKLWQDGRYQGLIGAMGTAKFSYENGGRLFADWEFTGVYVTAAAEAMPAQAPVTALTKFGSTAPTLTIGGSATPLVANVEIDLGNIIGMREDVLQTSGYLHAVVDSRKPTVTLDFEAALVADYTPFATLVAGTSAALSIVFSNGTNTITFAAPALQYASVGTGSRGGRLTDPATFRCAASSGDDELSITAA